MDSFLTFFRNFPSYLQLEVDKRERAVLPLWELMEDLQLESLCYIQGRGGEYLSIRDDINLLELKSQMYEVNGVPDESDDIEESALGEASVVPSVLADVYERQTWNEVVNFLANGDFPARPMDNKAKENFSRRCNVWYALGSPDTNSGSPNLYFTSNARGKVLGIPFP
jgi:hypothetical protein